MIDGNTRDFIEKLYYEDHYIVYDDEKFFFNGCQTLTAENEYPCSVRLEIYNLGKMSPASIGGGCHLRSVGDTIPH